MFKATATAKWMMVMAAGAALVWVVGCNERPKAAEAPAGPTAVIEVDSTATYDQTLQNAPVVMVDFFATWCYPCQMLKPTIAKLSMDYKDRVEVLSVDVDKHGDLASRYDIQSIPTILIFKNGEQQARLEGAQDRGAYESVLKTLVADKTGPAPGDSD